MNIMGPPRAKALRHGVAAIAQCYDRVALVLQGGGALGPSLQVAEAGCAPNWISGVSIGAINSAIIAGNPPAKRLQNLETFWTTIFGRKIWSYPPEGDISRLAQSNEFADDDALWASLIEGAAIQRTVCRVHLG